MEVAEVKPQEKQKKKRTIKKKLIIKSSSSSKSLKNSPPKSPPKSPATQEKKTKKVREKKPKEAKTKKDKIKPEPIKEKKPKEAKTKKRKLIIASSTTSEIIPIENKNENKTDLNISQQISKMPVTIRLNEKFIDIMEQLANIMLKQGEPFRARAYQKAQETIMAYPADILSPDDLKGKPNIGPTIMEKLNEYVQTGTLRVLEREKTNPVNILGEVYGIGPKKSKGISRQRYHHDRSPPRQPGRSLK